METQAAPGAGIEAGELATLEAAIRADEPAYLADLARLVNTDCGSYTPEGVDEIGRFVASFMTDQGARVEIRPDPAAIRGATVIGTWDGPRGTSDGPRTLLIGHMDTVFDPGTAAERPFTIDAEGIAHGPGVTDMKSGLLAGLYALKALVAGGPLPFERLTYIANPDEEIGSPSSTPHIREIPADADVCLVLECARAHGDIVSSRKGILDARIRVRGRPASSGSRSGTRPPAAHPTRTRRRGWGSPRSTASVRSAAWITRRRNTSRSPRSCRARRSWPVCFWRSGGTRSSRNGGRRVRSRK